MNKYNPNLRDTVVDAVMKIRTNSGIDYIEYDIQVVHVIARALVNYSYLASYLEYSEIIIWLGN